MLSLIIIFGSIFCYVHCAPSGNAVAGDSVQDFLEEVPSFIHRLQMVVQDPAHVAPERIEYFILISEEYLNTLIILCTRVENEIAGARYNDLNYVRAGIPLDDVLEMHNLLVHLKALIQQLVSTIQRRMNESNSAIAQQMPSNYVFESAQSDGERGRPRIPITQEQIEAFEELGFSYVQTARILCVTEQTLRNRRREFGMSFGTDRYTDLSDEELDSVVATVLQITPEAGERYVIGALRSRGVQVQRSRVRASILRIDPVGRACRRRRVIFRRQYYVPGPNSLWYDYVFHLFFSRF